MATESAPVNKPVDETTHEVDKKRRDGDLNSASDSLRQDWLDWSKKNPGEDPNKFWKPVEERLGTQVLGQLALVQAQQEGKLYSPAESTSRLTETREGHLPERKGTTAEDEFARRMDAYLRGALDDPAFIRQTAGRHDITVSDINSRIAALNRDNAAGGGGELKLSKEDATTLMDALSKQPAIRQRLFKGSPSDELDDRKMSKQDAERIAKTLPEDHPIRQMLDKFTKDWPKENGAPITYRELRERAAAADKPNPPAETQEQTQTREREQQQRERETAERKERARETVKQMLGVSDQALETLFPSKDKDGKPIAPDDREMTRDNVRKTLDDPNSKLTAEQRAYLQKLHDNWPEKDENGQPKPLKMANVLRDGGYESNGDDGKPDGKVNWGKFEQDRRTEQERQREAERGKIDPKTEEELRKRIGQFEDLPKDVRLNPRMSSFEAVRDYYLKRAQLTGEPTDVRSQREFYIKTLERNNIKIPKELADKFIADGRQVHLPRSLNREMPSTLKLTDDADSRTARMRIADRATASAEQHLGLNERQVKAVQEEQQRLARGGASVKDTSMASVLIKLSSDPNADKSLWPKPITVADVEAALTARMRQMIAARTIADDEYQKRLQARRPAA